MTDTERKIKDTTIELLLKEGKFGVSMQEIAQKSKVSRTVIHYYFRSKEKLLSVVDQEIVENIIIPRYQILMGSEPLEIKVENFLAESEKNCQTFPYVDIYTISEFATSESIRQYFMTVQASLKKLLEEIRLAISNNKILHSDPVQFLVDLFSLSSYSHIYFNFIKVNNDFFVQAMKENLASSRSETVKKILFQ